MLVQFECFQEPRCIVSQVLHGEIRPEDWTKFDEYAKRVRLILEVDGDKIDSSVYIRIAQIRGSVPLFPALQVLQFALHEYSGSLMNFVSPALRRIFLHTQNSHLPTPVVGTFLNALVDTTPHLTDLSIQSILSRSTVTVIPQLHTLQFVSLFSIGPPANSVLFRELSTLKHLKKLSFQFFDASRTVGFPLIANPDASVGFSVLEDLAIFGTWSEIMDALAGLRDDTITKLYVDVRSQNEPEVENSQWSRGACFKQIGLHFRSLKNLRISDSYPREDRPFDPFDLASFIIILHPLLDLHQIENIDFLGFPPCNMSDEDVEKIASAWPRAEHIGLPDRVIPGHIQSLPSIAALSSFARLCPELRELNMVIDARGTTELPPPILDHHLESLSVGPSWIDSAIVVASYIDCIFPYVGSFNYAENVDNAAWSQVVEWLPVLQNARAKQEIRSGARV